jgi:hypothetical protein
LLHDRTIHGRTIVASGAHRLSARNQSQALMIRTSKTLD